MAALDVTLANRPRDFSGRRGRWLWPGHYIYKRNTMHRVGGKGAQSHLLDHSIEDLLGISGLSQLQIGQGQP